VLRNVAIPYARQKRPRKSNIKPDAVYGVPAQPAMRVCPYTHATITLIRLCARDHFVCGVHQTTVPAAVGQSLAGYTGVVQCARSSAASTKASSDALKNTYAAYHGTWRQRQLQRDVSRRRPTLKLKMPMPAFGTVYFQHRMQCDEARCRLGCRPFRRSFVECGPFAVCRVVAAFLFVELFAGMVDAKAPAHGLSDPPAVADASEAVANSGASACASAGAGATANAHADSKHGKPSASASGSHEAAAPTSADESVVRRRARAPRAAAQAGHAAASVQGPEAASSDRAAVPPMSTVRVVRVVFPAVSIATADDRGRAVPVWTEFMACPLSQFPSAPFCTASAPLLRS
jgi:hypothetical protein